MSFKISIPVYASVCIILFKYINGDDNQIATEIYLPNLNESTIPKDDLNKTMILRYGFQQIKECKNFALAFLCMRKCLDLNYDVAKADRNCKCTCFTKKEKSDFPNKPTKTLWKLGVPTTIIPEWAKPHGQNIDINDSEESTFTSETITTIALHDDTDVIKEQHGDSTTEDNKENEASTNETPYGDAEELDATTQAMEEEVKDE